MGLRIAGHRRTDVPAFDVEDGEQSLLPACGQRLLEGGDPGRAEAFEERRLRFDRGHGAGELRDRAQPEFADTCCRARQPPCLEEVVVGVDAHAYGAVGGHRLAQPGGEHHALQSCRLRTPKVFSRTACSEVTAAANSAIVVISGTEFAVAAARIS